MVKRTRILLILTILFVLVLIFKIISVEEHFLHTENISDYSLSEYPLPERIFLNKIPAGAHIIAFSHYDYWYEAEDVYLEVNFENKKDMKDYIDSLIEKCDAAYPQVKPPVNGWFVEEINPYNERFTDMICTAYEISFSGKNVSGYEIIEGEIYSCCFAVISYSYEDLTVIQSFTSGSFHEDIHNYIPKYFERFQVVDSENHKRFIDTKR